VEFSEGFSDGSDPKMVLKIIALIVGAGFLLGGGRAAISRLPPRRRGRKLDGLGCGCGRRRAHR
jgi:hypothetical protein